MKNTTMAKSIHDFPSNTHFHWTATKVTNEEEQDIKKQGETEHPKIPPLICQQNPNPKPFLSIIQEDSKESSTSRKNNNLQATAVSLLKSLLNSTIGRNRASLGTRLIGTLFGHRRGRGHVHFVFQKESNLKPVFFIELGVTISSLVREMGSELVRIALECDKEKKGKIGNECRIIDEPVWRACCNGKKIGSANRRECGDKEWEIMKCLEPTSMGAGVLEIGNNEVIMYMRAKFERVVGSRDSEAFYMMNPDTNGAPELSLYLLRV